MSDTMASILTHQPRRPRLGLRNGQRTERGLQNRSDTESNGWILYSDDVPGWYGTSYLICSGAVGGTTRKGWLGRHNSFSLGFSPIPALVDLSKHSPTFPRTRPIRTFVWILRESG